MSLQSNYTNFKASSVRLYTWAAALIAILLAVVGPLVFLTTGGRELTNLPWHLWVVLPTLLLITLTAGILGFRHVSRHGEEISIRPDRRSTGRRR
jgi:hypothetical protein